MTQVPQEQAREGHNGAHRPTVDGAAVGACRVIPAQFHRCPR
jgi:hypothetical protein